MEILIKKGDFELKIKINFQMAVLIISYLL